MMLGNSFWNTWTQNTSYNIKLFACKWFHAVFTFNTIILELGLQNGREKETIKEKKKQTQTTSMDTEIQKRQKKNKE